MYQSLSFFSKDNFQLFIYNKCMGYIHKSNINLIIGAYHIFLHHILIDRQPRSTTYGVLKNRIHVRILHFKNWWNVVFFCIFITNWENGIVSSMAILTHHVVHISIFISFQFLYILKVLSSVMCHRYAVPIWIHVFVWGHLAYEWKSKYKMRTLIIAFNENTHSLICAYIYIYMCVCVYVHIYVYVFICICVYICICSAVPSWRGQFSSQFT